MKELTINPNRIELDEAYMQMAEVWARRSKGNRLQVGALIVKDRQIISDGYNGMPAGEPNDVCEYYDEQDDIIRTKPEVLHAESNALMKVAENGGVGAQGGTLYTTVSPCFECAKLIKQAKITRVVFRHLYRITDGIDMLRSRGVVVDQLACSESAPAPTPAPVIPTPAPVVREVLKPTVLAGKPSEFKPAPPAPVSSLSSAPILEAPPIPEMPAPVVQEISEADIQAMINAAVPSETKKKTLLDVDEDDGVYKSPFA